MPPPHAQAAHQLLEVYSILQPTLRECALRKCPAWLAEAACPKHSTAPGEGAGRSHQQQEQQPGGAALGDVLPEADGGRTPLKAELKAAGGGDPLSDCQVLL